MLRLSIRVLVLVLKLVPFGHGVILVPTTQEAPNYMIPMKLLISNAETQIGRSSSVRKISSPQLQAYFKTKLLCNSQLPEE